MRKLLLGLFLFGIFTFASAEFVKPNIAFAADKSNIVVQTIPGPTVGQKLADRAKSSWPWYITRASGLIAAVALVLLLLSGIGQVTGYTFRVLDPLTAWASHRALGLAFGVAVLVHMFSLLFDHFVLFNLWQILIPWLSSYKPVKLFGYNFGSLYVALGVLSFYLVVLVIITSLIWVEKRPRLWKLVHILSYAIIAFVFVHALYIGTDLVHGIFRWLWILAGVSIGYAMLHRLWRARTT